MSRRNVDLTPEMLIEALEKNKGFILAAVKHIKSVYGISISYSTVKSRINEWGMEDWLNDIRTSLVEDCMRRTFHKGIEKGDNHCIFWVLEKYGHHIDFLSGKDTETESKKGWKELLQHVKITESNTEEEHP
jgi:hypothetical protein